MMEPEDKTQEIAERAERLQEIGSSILRAARDELYLGMRFLDVALSSFSYQMDGQIHGFGTDGRVMYFQPQMLGGLYRENRILVNRGYLHMVFHCIFRHFAWRGTEGKKRADDGITIQERMRDLSCDIAVPCSAANGGRSMMESRRIWKHFHRRQVSGTEISWRR